MRRAPGGAAEGHVTESVGFDVIYAHLLRTGGAVGVALRERFGWPSAAIARAQLAELLTPQRIPARIER
jgi:hypothetical protein